MTDIPGLPSLPPGVNVLSSVVLLLSDAIGFLTGFAASPWGIYQNGQPVLTPDSVVSVGYKQGWSIADYKIEEGGFQSYDKVDTPFDTRVRLASGGSQANRQALLDGVAAIAGNLELYDVVTPEQVYSSVNISDYNVSRSATNGVGLIQIEIHLIEVRITATTQFQNTKSPTSQSQVDDGTVQPQSLPAGQTTDISTSVNN